MQCLLRKQKERTIKELQASRQQCAAATARPLSPRNLEKN
jgi:hypothetical protein